MIKQYDQLIKLILIGSSGVGKSSVLMQFAQNKFTQNYLTTIGVDFRFKTVKHQNKSIKFQIWDTAGQQRFRTITSAYYKGADGIIMVYDLTQPSSLDDIQNFWIPEAYNYCDKNIKVLLLGNKCDCDKKTNSSKSKQLVSSNGFKYAEVSAKTNEKIFESIRDFGLEVARDKASKMNPTLNNNTNSSTSNGQGQMSKTTAGSSNVSSTVHINKTRQSTQNLQKKKCC